MTVKNVKCLLAFPVEGNNLSVLRKQSNQLRKLTDIDTVLCLDSIRVYTREKMIKEGIPFVVHMQQIYLPFLGIVLSKSGQREVESKGNISFLTQRLILTAIYNDWKSMTLTETARALDISKMSVTRCFDELSSLELNIIKTEGKLRRFLWESNRRILWDTIQPYLNNPVRQQYRLSENVDISVAKLGGMSAVCHYSMLDDNSFKTYSLSRDASKALEISRKQLVPDGETPFMILQIMGYDYKYHEGEAVDPLSAILSLTDEEKADPRVEKAIDEILEDCLSG